MEEKQITRRNFLRLFGYGSAALVVGGGAASLLSSCTTDSITETTARKFTSSAIASETASSLTTENNGNFIPDLEISLRAIETDLPILKGKTTRVLHYEGEVLNGDPDALQIIPNSYLGPIFRVKKGQKLRVHFSHELLEPSVVHWHGLHVPEVADGHPKYAIDKGETYIYDFEIANRAGTYWYHPHPHGRTGPQVYFGLAGLFIVTDDEENLLDLPSGEYDLPIVIQDRSFDNDNQLVYGGNGMMDQMLGFLGNQFLINGQADLSLSVSTRPYRLRLLNGSNSRIYKIAWDDDTPLTVIGTDGGLVEKPINRSYITLVPSQRVELWVDFGKYIQGDQVQLISLPFFAGETAGGGMMGSTGIPQGAGFRLLTVNINKEEKSNQKLPERLSRMNWNDLSDAVNNNNPRNFVLAMGRGMGWSINGRTFEMTNVAKNEIVKLNDLEIWQFENQISGGSNSGMNGGMGGGMMGGMVLPHPMHVHGLQFQVIERQVDSATRSAWESIREGHLDEGWRDTVLVMPGEKVKILLKFEDFTGLYLYHCHNLEHEDMGMMRNYRVIA